MIVYGVYIYTYTYVFIVGVFGVFEARALLARVTWVGPQIDAWVWGC